MSSFLSSVLSSIGSGGAGQSQAPSQSRPPALTRASSATGPAAQTLHTNGTANRVAPPSLSKRKAESDSDGARAKAPRKEAAAPVRPTPISRTGTSSPLPRSTKKPGSTSVLSSIPYRGTAQPSASTNNGRKAAPLPVNSAPKPAAPAVAPKPSLSKSVPAAATKPASSIPPKKGSFQEVMARAKAAQETSRSVGAIKHKSVEKTSKKEKLTQEAEARAKQGTAAASRIVHKGQGKGPEPKIPRTSEPEKKRPADLGYQGTMRPSPRESNYQGTLNKGSALKSRSGSYDRSRSASLGARPPPKRYNYYDDEDLDDEVNYESDGSSDMEAGVFDVDREEQEALRIARREDELALKEEEELKRKKLERKRGR